MKSSLAIAGLVSILPTTAVAQTLPAQEPAAGVAIPAPWHVTTTPAPPWGHATADIPPAPPSLPAIPAARPYDGGPVPRGMRVELRRDDRLLVLGATLFGSMYLGSVIGAAVCATGAGCQPGLEWLFAPVVGPFAALAFPQHSDDRALLIFDGIAQGAGLAMMVGALATAHEVLVPDLRKDGLPAPAPRFCFYPGAPGATAGLSISVTNL